MGTKSLAINGGKPVRQRPWPPPHAVDQEDTNQLIQVLNSPAWSNAQQVAAFETAIAQYCQSEYAVMLTNATAALKLALLACGIKPGDEVIIPGITYYSVATAILECGAQPIPVDIDPSSCAITRETVSAGLSEKTKAIIPTHLFCSLCNMPPILDLAEEMGLAVIEDAAHAIGATRFGRRVGALGSGGILSFNQKKLLSCGEGGCFLTNNSSLYESVRYLRAVDGVKPRGPQRLPGVHKVSEFQAAVANSQLKKLPGRLALMQDRAELLRAKIEKLPGVRMLARLPDTDMQTFYNPCFDITGVADIVRFRRALSAELSLPVQGSYVPFSETDMVNHQDDARYHGLGERLAQPLAHCIQVFHERSVRFSHVPLLGNEADVLDVAIAVEKVLEHST